MFLKEFTNERELRETGQKLEEDVEGGEHLGIETMLVFES